MAWLPWKEYIRCVQRWFPWYPDYCRMRGYDEGFIRQIEYRDRQDLLNAELLERQCTGKETMTIEEDIEEDAILEEVEFIEYLERQGDEDALLCMPWKERREVLDELYAQALKEDCERAGLKPRKI